MFMHIMIYNKDTIINIHDWPSERTVPDMTTGSPDGRRKANSNGLAAPAPLKDCMSDGKPKRRQRGAHSREIGRSLTCA